MSWGLGMGGGGGPSQTAMCTGMGAYIRGVAYMRCGL